MLNLKALDPYLVQIEFAYPPWIGNARHLAYLKGIGFYQLQMELSIGACLDLDILLESKIKGYKC